MNQKTKTKLPDPLASFEEKKLPEYGLKIAEYISQEWFNGGLVANGCEFMGRSNWIKNRRLYHRGEQDLDKYKKIMARREGNLKYLNLDWRPINVLSKFNYTVSNALSEDNYKMDIRATDRYSSLERKNKIVEHKKNMMSLPMLEQAVKLGLPDLRPKGFVPEDEDELEFYTEIKDRPKIEIAEEIAIDFIKGFNDFHNIKERCDQDVVQCGLMAAQVYVDPINGISVRYVDIETAVHSYVEKNDFSDAYYYGSVETITLSEIRSEGNFEESELREIAKTYGTSGNNIYSNVDYKQCDFNDLIDLKINVLRFCWKTSKTLKYKKYLRGEEVVKVSKRNDDWAVPEGAENKQINKNYNVWFEGNYIIGTKKIYGYKECENIEKGEINKSNCPFVFRASEIYKNRLKSFQQDIEILSDQMQYAHLKIQHLLAELKPDMLSVDLDALAEIGANTKGGNKKESWQEAFSIMQVSGVVLTQRIDLGEDGIKEAPTVKPMPQQQGSSLAQAMNTWAHYYNQIREVTGINPARDGSLPADAGLRVNQMAQMASNTVTKHIVRASLDFDKSICQTISSRLKTVYTYKEGKDIQEFYNRAIGKQNMDAMEAMKDRSLRDFGFTLNMVPSGQDVQDFREDLSIAMKEGSIDVETKIEAQQLAKTNLKLANEYLKYMRRKNLKQKAKDDEQRQQMVTQSNIASAEATSKARINEKVAQASIDVDKEAKLSQIRLQERQAMLQIEAPGEEREFEQEVYLKKLDSITQFDNKKYLEEKKDKRIDKQSTQQSEMIDQRKNNSQPINFENEFSLDDEMV
jgi:hypothetical protein